MNWVTPILATVLTTVTLGWLALLLRMFVLRHEFEIAARSPSLAIVAMFALLVSTVVILLQWLLQSMGKSMPCFVIFSVFYSCEWYGTTCNKVALSRTTSDELVLCVGFSAGLMHNSTTVEFGSSGYISRLHPRSTTGSALRSPCYTTIIIPTRIPKAISCNVSAAVVGWASATTAVGLSRSLCLAMG